jgi:hypothetical protein
MCEEDLPMNEDDYDDRYISNFDEDNETILGGENMAIEEVEENEECSQNNTQ